MANMSALHTIAVNIRTSGSKDNKTGFVYGGTYFPEHMKNGKRVSARWEGNCFVNHLGYTDDNGVYHEPSNDMVRIVAWNGKNSTPGRGLADIFAKIASVGKEFSASLRMRQFQKRLIINDVPMTDAQGQPITYTGYNFEIKDSLIWGDDAANVVAQEIANWPNYPYATFASRPTFWNVPGHQDAAAWKYIMEERMKHVFKEGPSYGYARVIIPDGATVIDPTQRGTQQPMNQSMTQQPMGQPMGQQNMQPPMTQQPMMQQPMMQQPMMHQMPQPQQIPQPQMPQMPMQQPVGQFQQPMQTIHAISTSMQSPTSAYQQSMTQPPQAPMQQVPQMPQAPMQQEVAMSKTPF